MDIIKKYVDEFNLHDDEFVKNDITNEKAYEWMAENVPHLICPDKILEKAYYFRWWTYRKHIKNTPDGYVITEFLSKVSWSRKHNTINAAAGHHIAEGKWLRCGQKYLDEYINFFLSGKGDAHQYSSWLLWSALSLWEHTGNFPLTEELYEKCKKYYEIWEDEHKTPCGLFWSYDGNDAMEFSISGTRDMKRAKGIRPTLNSYMYGEAMALSKIAAMLNKKEDETLYREKAEKIRTLINKYLYKDGFYRAYHPIDENFENIPDKLPSSPRELIGYIPWQFGILCENGDEMFDLLLDENVFYTDFGLATADKSHPLYLFENKHECLWNGYVWPFATSQTLNSLREYVKLNPQKKKYKDMYMTLLHQYAKMHQRHIKCGKKVMWIDEVRHPMKDEWSSREILENMGWQECKGGYERGKDYNHSTFCDLVLSYILNIDYNNGNPVFNVNVPDGWDSFSINNLFVCGREYSVMYDKTNGVSVKEKCAK